MFTPKVSTKSALFFFSRKLSFSFFRNERRKIHGRSSSSSSQIIYPRKISSALLAATFAHFLSKSRNHVSNSSLNPKRLFSINLETTATTPLSSRSSFTAFECSVFFVLICSRSLRSWIARSEKENSEDGFKRDASFCIRVDWMD